MTFDYENINKTMIVFVRGDHLCQLHSEDYKYLQLFVYYMFSYHNSHHQNLQNVDIFFLDGW